MVATDPGADSNELELVSRWLGKTIKEKYVVESMIGSGGMAVVYAARHRNGKRFAVKMLHRELSLNTFVRQRFLREGYVANRVDHPGAVAVIDDDVTEDGSAFLVMELLTGTTVEALWEGSNQRLSVESVLAIAEQLLDVLSSAHAQNIVHRDLKPANMFVTRDGSVKVLDFGIARLRENTDSSKTETGTTLGTPLFMPPEQASGRSRDVDARTDLWAIGATMFSLLSGEYVHDGENATQVLIQAATTQARSLGTAVPGAHPAVVALVDKALAFDSDDRWESAAAMRAAVTTAHEIVFGGPTSQERLKKMVLDAVGGSSKGDAISGVAQTVQQVTPTPSRQNSTPGRSAPRAAPLPARMPSAPSWSAVPNTPAPGNTPPPVSAVTAQSPVPRSAAVSAFVVVAGLATIAAAAGGVWFMHSRSAASHPVTVETTAAVSTPPPPLTAVALAPTTPPTAVAMAPTTASPPAPALPETTAQRPVGNGPGANGRHGPQGKTPQTSTANSPPPAVATAEPPPVVVAPPPPATSAEPNKNKATPVIDRSNPFN